MKIAIDATTIYTNNGGVTSYLKGILNGLEELDVPPEINLYHVGKEVSKQKPIEKQINTLYRELYWQQYELPKIAKKDKADILFSPAHFIALKASMPRVVTFHDMYILRSPSSFKKWQALYSNYIYPKIVKSGATIIADSNFTAEEFRYFYPNFKGELKVVYCGISEDWKLVKNSQLVIDNLKRHRLPNDFILAVGSIEPRKNLPILFKILEEDKLNILPPLVLVSAAGWRNTAEIKIINKLVEQKKVYWLQNISREDLVLLYNKALVFIYPSLYEGMGFPPLEAMACGCPVITSNNSALKEIYTGTAEMINPHNSEEICEKIKLLLQSSENRNEMIRKGLILREKFSFNKAAQETMSVFKEALG